MFDKLVALSEMKVYKPVVSKAIVSTTPSTVATSVLSCVMLAVASEMKVGTFVTSV